MVTGMAESKKYEITVTAQATYLTDQSSEDDSRFVFAYRILIVNTGTVPTQLISRHWIITDSENRVQEVRGLGVIGEQPMLQPTESYEYTSGAVIETPVGTMSGSYHMVAEDGTHFDVVIPEFVLSIPRILH